MRTESYSAQTKIFPPERYKSDHQSTFFQALASDKRSRGTHQEYGNLGTLAEIQAYLPETI